MKKKKDERQEILMYETAIKKRAMTTNNGPWILLSRRQHVAGVVVVVVIIIIKYNEYREKRDWAFFCWLYFFCEHCSVAAKKFFFIVTILIEIWAEHKKHIHNNNKNSDENPTHTSAGTWKRWKEVPFEWKRSTKMRHTWKINAILFCHLHKPFVKWTLTYN